MSYICNLDAECWQLFSSSMDCTSAVKALNAVMDIEVNAAFDKLKEDENYSEQKLAQNIVWAVQKVQNLFSDYGASDSEPQNVLCDEVDDAFKRHLNVVVETTRC